MPYSFRVFLHGLEGGWQVRRVRQSSASTGPLGGDRAMAYGIDSVQE